MYNRCLIFAAIIFLSLTDWSCNKQKGSTNKKDTKVSETILDLGALPLTASYPLNNPSSPEKVKLGRFLFFDPILSGNKDVACATCHLPEFNYAEFMETSIGVNGQGSGSKRRFKEPNTMPFVKRNSQAVLNTAFNGISNNEIYRAELAPMFWDRRAKGLEEQSIMPIKTFEEMMGHAYNEENIIPAILKRLQSIPTYQHLFHAAFGPNSITESNLAKAIASYERTLIANNTRFDQYMRGDSNALSLSEKDGMNLFLKTGCVKCHSGPMFSDFKLHTLGVPDTENRKETDTGTEGQYAFRTPTLRNLRYTAPYMHSGKFATLEQVLLFYEDISGGKILNPHVKAAQMDTLATQMNVNFKDISRILEFLNCLNDDNFDKSVPDQVPSGLPAKGNIF